MRGFCVWSDSESGQSLIELLVVISLGSILIPLLIGIWGEAFDRLHPMGEHGRHATVVSQANTMLLRLQRDVEQSQRCIDGFDVYSIRSNDIILKQNDYTIVWHFSDTGIQRISIIGSETQITQYSPHISHWKVSLVRNLLAVDFAVQVQSRRTFETSFHTVFACPG